MLLVSFGALQLLCSFGDADCRNICEVTKNSDSLRPPPVQLLAPGEGVGCVQETLYVLLSPILATFLRRHLVNSMSACASKLLVQDAPTGLVRPWH